MQWIDFKEEERVSGRGYHGHAGQKQAYFHDGDLWMVKFPQSTRNFRGTQLPSYTSSPLSEYIGSQVYSLLGIPVHETVLGSCKGKLVVGCKDFTIHGGELMDYHQIKNTMDEERISGTTSSPMGGECLRDVLTVLAEAEDFAPVRKQAIERFWDMFLVDAFILNNDRNNGNWGILVNRYNISLAPVFDNGNAFFNKRDLSVFQKRFLDPALLEQDALSGRSFFTEEEEHHINPLRFIGSLQNPDCTAALIRFANRVDLGRILDMLQDIPEQMGNFDILAPGQREFYFGVMETILQKSINPTLIKLGETPILLGGDRKSEKSEKKKAEKGMTL